MATGTLRTFKHKRFPLNSTVIREITPIYQELSSDDLLKRCLGAHTQNSNESLNSCIWNIAPKHLHSGKSVIELATYFAVMTFNEGYRTILKTMDVLGLTVGLISDAYATKRDFARVNRSEKRIIDAAKQAKIKKSEDQAAMQESFSDQEGEIYAPGIAE